jgi:hypothetical protein
MRVKTGAAAILATVLTLAGGPIDRALAQTAATDEAVARSIATLFRSARAVISDHQALINDAAKGDKGLTADRVVEQAKENYRKATGKDVALHPATVEGKLAQALLDAVREVMDKAQPLINKPGLGFKGFIPAVFGKQVADAFRRTANGTADIKLTAPKTYVRNRANAPDAWEDQVIEGKFKAAGWEKGKAHGEPGELRGKRAYRLIVPEYYGASCLACHGDPKGGRDITGGKKEGGKLDELGGAISVAVYAR